MQQICTHIPCLQAPYGCTESLNAHTVRRHQQSECRFMTLKCFVCKLPVARQDFDAHSMGHLRLGRACGLILPLACPLRVDGCLFDALIPQQVRRHIPLCPHWRVQCAACGETLVRSALAEHQAHACARSRDLRPFFQPFLEGEGRKRDMMLGLSLGESEMGSSSCSNTGTSV